MPDASVFPEPLSFRYPWRPYQARVLAELESHLDDRRLHVVAAPGAGKTVLGIETIRRLNAPTLILSPTLTIRNQWLDRLQRLFLEPDDRKRDWLSTKVLRPGLITSTTYQALHRAVTGQTVEDEEPEEEPEETALPAETGAAADVAAILTRTGIRTVVLDECHHLRSEWWKALTRTIAGLDKPTVVSLTATPPYDVPPHEWERYEKLCGPADAEIPVPELVAAKNLCPHQDYVYLSTPSPEEKAALRAFRSETAELLDRLAADEDFIRAIASHPFLRDPDAHVETILDRVAFYSSVAIFLNHARNEAPRRLLKTMGLKNAPIPKLSLAWWEELLSGCLYTERENLAAHEFVLARIEKDMKRIGAIERREVRLRATKQIEKLLSTSLSKLESIADIVALEHDNLGGDLRQVILTDYIRADHMPRGPGDLRPIDRIGVVPIFERLRRSGPDGIRLGILSGSLVVIPRDARSITERCCHAAGIAAHRLRFRELPHDEAFLEVDCIGKDRKRLVRLMTEVFGRGGITVLVGTKSLLGEGWDAPSVNSLVLASFVGSFMLSNQMRGRAIRVQADRPEKTANIWHLACVEEREGDREDGPAGPDGGPDWDTMTRRFRAFMGPSRLEPVIENGIGRLDLGNPPFSESRVRKLNRETKRLARDRAGLRSVWDAALAEGEGYRMVQEFEEPSRFVPRPYVFRDAIRMLLQQGLFTTLFILDLVRFAPSEETDVRTFATVAAVILGLAVLGGMPYFLKALWLLIRHGSVTGSLRQVGKALLRALAHAGIVETDANRMRVTVEKVSYEATVCSLEGATTYEKSVFLDALGELLGPVENPRYLLTRDSGLGPFRRRDIHPVPAVLGRRKDQASYLAKMWRKYVGRTRLIYTRNTEGRKALLKARGQSLAGAMLKKSERRNRWN